jgi:hypothetical protein
VPGTLLHHTPRREFKLPMNGNRPRGLQSVASELPKMRGSLPTIGSRPHTYVRT